jgi:predicted house-cleaning noncanonical NTP pyrophosphatase (MazG superfamily)
MLTRKNPKIACAGRGQGKKPKKHFVEAESIEDKGDGKDDNEMEEIIEDTTEEEVVAAVEETAQSADILCIQADGKLIMVQDPKDIPVKVAMLMAEGGTKQIEMVTFKSMSEYENAKGGVTKPEITVNEVPPMVTPIKETKHATS